MNYVKELVRQTILVVIHGLTFKIKTGKSIPLVSFDTSTRYSFRQRVSKYTSGIVLTLHGHNPNSFQQQESSAEPVSPVPILSFMGTQSMVFGQVPRVYHGGQQDEMIPMPIMTST